MRGEGAQGMALPLGLPLVTPALDVPGVSPGPGIRGTCSVITKPMHQIRLPAGASPPAGQAADCSPSKGQPDSPGAQLHRVPVRSGMVK